MVTYHSGVMRGCGRRVAGGVYLEVGTVGEGEGYPIEHFLLDPPPLVPDALAVTPRGLHLIERGGIWHVVDHVGSESYPNVADFIEEVRHFGVSRRAQKNLDFSKLTSQSRMIFVHARAYIANWKQYDCAKCPKAECACVVCDEKLHRGADSFCAEVWWRDVEGGESQPQFVPRERTTQVRRHIGDVTYHGRSRDAKIVPRYHTAFFLSLPLGRIAVVRDALTDAHQATTAAVREKLSPSIALEEVDE
jgi:hypothetical protein